MSNVNQGHRERLRQRMMTEGLHNFQDHEVLELLLFQFIPRKDTNKIAHDLLNRFGSIANVLDASPQQLMAVSGISEVTACNISVLKEVWLRYKRSAAVKISLAGLSSIIRYSQTLIADSYVERLVVVYVDHATNFLVSEEFASDNPANVNPDLKKIVSTAMSCNAAGVVLFHCHVKGVVVPSAADFAFTEKLYVTLANLNIVLLDHFIFNERNEFFSFFKENEMTRLAQEYAKTHQTNSDN